MKTSRKSRLQGEILLCLWRRGAAANVIRMGKVVMGMIALGSLCIARSSNENTPRPGLSRASVAASSSVPAAVAEIERDLRAGRFREARAKAQEVLKTRPQYALAWTYLGMASVQLGANQEAVEAFERAIALDPKDPAPYFDLALLYASLNQLDKAIDRYRKGLSIDDRNGTAFYNYGRLLITKGDNTGALGALERALQINPKDAAARIALVEALLGANQRQEARHQVRTLLATEGVQPPSLVSLGGLLVRGGELDLAKTVLTRALAASPGSAAATIQLSKLYLALNDQPSAIRASQRAVELAPASLEANLALAETLISSHQKLQALKFLLKIEPRFRDSAAFQYTLGIAQDGVNHLQAAIYAFKRAVQLDPSLDLAHFFLGEASLRAGDLKEAEASFKAATSLKPANFLYLQYLARLYEQKGAGSHEAALETTKKVLALDPKDVEARERLGKWAKDEGDLPRARALLEQVVADDPQRISARVLLASVYYRLNLRKAGDEQQKVVRSLEAEAQKHAGPPQQP